MKWKKLNGIILELHDSEANMKAAADAGLVPVDPETKEGEDTTILYQRLKGELVEGQPPAGDEVIIEEEIFAKIEVDQAIECGWYKTKDDAANAPPDKPGVDMDIQFNDSGTFGGDMEPAASGAVTMESNR